MKKKWIVITILFLCLPYCREDKRLALDDGNFKSWW